MAVSPPFRPLIADGRTRASTPAFNEFSELPGMRLATPWKESRRHAKLYTCITAIRDVCAASCSASSRSGVGEKRSLGNRPIQLAPTACQASVFSRE